MMMKMLTRALMISALFTSVVIVGRGHAEMTKSPDAATAESAVAPRVEANGLVAKATKVVGEFKESSIANKFYKSIDQGLAVLIVPSYERAGLGLGGEGGKGVILKKIPSTTEWTYPAFFSMGGATFGPQVGFEKGALLVVIHKQQTLDEIMNGELTLGAEARAVIGTKGVQAQTTKTGGDEIDVFLHSKGAFAGAIVKGGDIRPLKKLNLAFYGRKVAPKEILKPAGPMNPQADALRLALAKLVRKSMTTPTN